MKLLAVETATETCSVALATGDEVLERFRHAPRKHADLLLPWISELLSEAGIGLTGLDAIVFSRGPGSFTSLRIGIGVVQGLAWGADIPVVPVSSLQALAQASAHRGLGATIVALDARMNEVYCGTFRPGENGLMQAVGDEMVCPPERVTQLESKGWSGLGNGFDRYEELSRFAGKLESVDTDAWPSATAMISIARDWLSHNEALPAAQAQPVYIRDKVAEKPVQQA